MMVKATEFIASFPGPTKLSVTCSMEKFLVMRGERLGTRVHNLFVGWMCHSQNHRDFIFILQTIPTSHGSRALTNSVQQ